MDELGAFVLTEDIAGRKTAINGILKRTGRYHKVCIGRKLGASESNPRIGGSIQGLGWKDPMA